MPCLNAKRLFLSFLLITILTFSHTNTVQSENSQAEAEQTIAAAEDRINEDFILVGMAEEAGANVEDLIGKLNAALNLTLKAHDQFSNGNFSKAITLASNAIEITEEVANQAEVKRARALSNVQWKYGTIIFLVISDAIICLIGIFLIHKWQQRSLMKKKPKLDQ